MMRGSGTIIMWSGSIASIPTGWFLCDGNNGTPDLEKRFVVGAGDSYDVGNNGGNTSHDHTFTGDYHRHEIIPGTDLLAGDPFELDTGQTVSTGTTDLTNALPKHFILAFIMLGY